MGYVCLSGKTPQQQGTISLAGHVQLLGNKPPFTV